MLVSRLAQVQADCEAAQRQAESASAAARQFMEDKENKVSRNLSQSGQSSLRTLGIFSTFQGPVKSLKTDLVLESFGI